MTLFATVPGVFCVPREDISMDHLHPLASPCIQNKVQTPWKSRQDSCGSLCLWNIHPHFSQEPYNWCWFGELPRSQCLQASRTALQEALCSPGHDRPVPSWSRSILSTEKEGLSGGGDLFQPHSVDFIADSYCSLRHPENIVHFLLPGLC